MPRKGETVKLVTMDVPDEHLSEPPSHGKVTRRVSPKTIQRICAQMISNPYYLEEFERRLIAGLLKPQLEAMIWHYAGGKPKTQVEVKVNETKKVVEMTDEQLLEETEQLRAAFIASRRQVAERIENARKEPEKDGLGMKWPRGGDGTGSIN